MLVASEMRWEKALIHGLRDVPNIDQYIRRGTRWSSRGGPTHDVKVPTFDTTLWRYMDLAKYLSLLENRALFFARADKLGDPFEGAWSDANLRYLELAKDLPTGSGHSNEALAWRMIVKATKEDRRFTLINCWHASNHESEAMWRLYSGLGYGLAIKTDFKTFIHSFTDRVPDIIGNVEYISYETDQMPWSMNAPFLHKRVSFGHENEVRAILSCHNLTETDRSDVKKIDYSKDICEIGMPFSIDPEELIQGVVVSPYAESWILDLAASVSKRYGIGDVVRPSSMSRNPVW